jgi:hypothetical protein
VWGTIPPLRPSVVGAVLEQQQRLRAGSPASGQPRAQQQWCGCVGAGSSGCAVCRCEQQLRAGTVGGSSSCNCAVWVLVVAVAASGAAALCIESMPTTAAAALGQVKPALCLLPLADLHITHTNTRELLSSSRPAPGSPAALPAPFVSTSTPCTIPHVLPLLLLLLSLSSSHRVHPPPGAAPAWWYH